MSFTYDAWHHFEVTAKGNVKLHCHGCGKHWGDWVQDVTVRVLLAEFRKHLAESHCISKDYFQGWSLL